MKLISILLGVALGALSAIAQPTQPLVMQQIIKLPGVPGKFDHFAIDLAGKRLFAAATGNHSVEVIDLATGKVVQSISGLGKPHGLVWAASTHTLYVADGALAELREYRGAPLELAGTLKLSNDADDMVYNEADHLLFVGHGGSDAKAPASIAVVDTDGFRRKTNISVGSHPEALEIDPESRRVFANIADSGEVGVLDGAGNALSTSWKLKGAGHNVPLAYDLQDHVLYVACRTPAVLLALDGSSGKELARIPTGDGADDLFYDRAARQVYVVAGAGEVDVFQAGAPGTLHFLGKVPTAPGAKTALFVPQQSLLYVGIPGVGDGSAEIRVYSTSFKRGNE
jgi:DNA-binding beta-propeller fold protein YncE